MFSRLAKSLFVISIMLLSSVSPAQPLGDLLRVASRDGRYAEPASAELEQARELFRELAAGRYGERSRNLAATLAMELIAIDGDTWVLREQAEAKRGRGLFVFRQAGGPLLLVPHSFKDEMTREIGLALFAEGKFGAAAWNTVPRNEADMAHLTQTYFQTFTLALAERQPRNTVLQIHGFDPGKRRTEAAAGMAAILSAGHGYPSGRLRQQVQCLRERLGESIGLYPETVRELGGTGNAQGNALLAMGVQGFVHAELSRGLRGQLLQETSIRRHFLVCLELGGGR